MEQPNEPLVVTNHRSYTPMNRFSTLTRILWKIVYILDDSEIPSPIWGFTTRAYTDLTVTQITIPDTTFSGQSFDVQWTVENIGIIDVFISLKGKKTPKVVRSI